MDKAMDEEIIQRTFGEAIQACISSGKIVAEPFRWWNKYRALPARCDMNKGIIYINTFQIQYLITYLKLNNPFMSDKRNIKSLMKPPVQRYNDDPYDPDDPDKNINHDDPRNGETELSQWVNVFNSRQSSTAPGGFGTIIGGIGYHAIHLYNMYNRGALAKHDLVKKWYKKFFESNINSFTNLYTLSDKVSAIFYIGWMNIILNYYELKAYSGTGYSDYDTKKLNEMLNKFNNNVKEDIGRYGFDASSMSSYGDWFKGFVKDFQICFKNKSYIIEHFDKKFLEIQDFKVLNMKAIQSAYKKMGPFMDPLIQEGFIQNYFKTSAFKELYSIAEPLAQTFHISSCASKFSYIEDLQKIAGQGLSYLNFKK